MKQLKPGDWAMIAAPFLMIAVCVGSALIFKSEAVLAVTLCLWFAWSLAEWVIFVYENSGDQS